MNAKILVYILLGILQGFLEWIPLSSEGIIAFISENMIKGIHPIDLAIFLHLGSFFSVALYFREDWISILHFRNPDLTRLLFFYLALYL